jgi:hypothetical protein
MDFGVSFEIGYQVSDKMSVIFSQNRYLHDYFLDKDYGEGIKHIYIGLICVQRRKGYEKFHKIRKPKYKAIEKTKSLDGTIKQLNGYFTYDIEIDFESVVNLTAIETNHLFVVELLNSLSKFDYLSKKLKDFDKEQFKENLKEALDIFANSKE